MKLLIDAGNTRIKWAWVNGETWLNDGALPLEQVGELARQLAAVTGVRQVWVSNVAGDALARPLRNLYPDAATRFVAARPSQCGVRNGYDDPARLGSDRWAALIAAWHLVRGRCLVVNSGTATTIDTLSSSAEFSGGLILPGVDLMQRSLGLATAQLDPAPGCYTPLPRNTADAMLSGAIQASCGAIERQHALLNDPSAMVVLSGGNADRLKEQLNLPLLTVDNLTLRGLLLIAQEEGAQ
ncbi:MAG: type III pantothenate kinase [Gallionella sp.]|nr:type III pantothenate kinase [Gallionella sp.]